jgi:hypothetical protein
MYCNDMMSALLVFKGQSHENLIFRVGTLLCVCGYLSKLFISFFRVKFKCKFLTASVEIICSLTYRLSFFSFLLSNKKV